MGHCQLLVTGNTVHYFVEQMQLIKNLALPLL